MKTLEITSPESLDSAVADVVRWKIQHTAAIAEKDAEVAAIEKRHQDRITKLLERIADTEAEIHAYCAAHRAELFPERKSRETNLAIFGFRFTPHRVETSSRKIKWKDVVDRLKRLSWGKAYIRTPEPQPDKNALLADREKLTSEQLTAAGITFSQDEEFRIDPKPETAPNTVL